MTMLWSFYPWDFKPRKSFELQKKPILKDVSIIIKA